MHLTVFPLNPQFADVRADISDANMLFKRVRSLFGHQPSDNRELFRVWVTADGMLFLIVQSPTAIADAAITALPLRYLRADVYRCNLATVLAGIDSGSVHEFDVLASISKRNNGHETPLRSDAERRDWLMRKAEQHGFAVATQHTPALPLAFGPPRAIWALKGKHKQVQLTPTHCVGQLCVTDVTRFIESVYAGIGRSKALGLGLIVLPRLLLPESMWGA
jgi:CRISPR-associated protein Cas6/Cse3/CasE subtype I-E